MLTRYFVCMFIYTDVGWVSQMNDGCLWCHFDDGTQLAVHLVKEATGGSGGHHQGRVAKTGGRRKLHRRADDARTDGEAEGPNPSGEISRAVHRAQYDGLLHP